jgi:hypothetical protein
MQQCAASRERAQQRLAEPSECGFIPRNERSSDQLGQPIAYARAGAKRQRIVDAADEREPGVLDQRLRETVDLSRIERPQAANADDLRRHRCERSPERITNAEDRTEAFKQPIRACPQTDGDGQTLTKTVGDNYGVIIARARHDHRNIDVTRAAESHRALAVGVGVAHGKHTNQD